MPGKTELATAAGQHPDPSSQEEPVPEGEIPCLRAWNVFCMLQGSHRVRQGEVSWRPVITGQRWQQ